MYTCTQITCALPLQPFFLTGDVEGCVIALVNSCAVLVECVVCDDTIGFLRSVPVHTERVRVWDCTRRENFVRSWKRIEVKWINCCYIYWQVLYRRAWSLSMWDEQNDVDIWTCCSITVPHVCVYEDKDGEKELEWPEPWPEQFWDKLKCRTNKCQSHQLHLIRGTHAFGHVSSFSLLPLNDHKRLIHIYGLVDPGDKVHAFTDAIQFSLNKAVPFKRISIRNNVKPRITVQVQNLIKKKMAKLTVPGTKLVIVNWKLWWPIK